jgi:hypothetical protein
MLLSGEQVSVLAARELLSVTTWVLQSVAE